MWCSEQTNNKIKVAIIVILGICLIITVAVFLNKYTRRPIEETKILEEIKRTSQKSCAEIGGNWSTDGDCWKN